jgi:uncharacterized protein YjbI with pentapeptide repeats
VAAILAMHGVRRYTILSFDKCMASPECSQPGQTPTQQKRDWIAILATALPGLAALVAVAFTYVSVKATENQVQIARQGQNTAEQGQITDRYNAAITNLGSRSIDIRLGGIYALQRLMQDSPRDQPTIVAVLCAFVRDRSMPAQKPQIFRLATDIQAAVTVVGTRNRANDGRATVVDLDQAQLARGRFDHDNLTRAVLTGADLTGARLVYANLTRANLINAFLTDAQLFGANLLRASLTGAHLTGAYLTDANLTDANLVHANLTRAHLEVANLTRAFLDSANLTRAHLYSANLHGAILAQAQFIGSDLSLALLTRANLERANLTGANLKGADLTGAHLSGANFSHADLTRANLTGAQLTGAIWPTDVEVPEGWQRDTDSGRLKRTAPH